MLKVEIVTPRAVVWRGDAKSVQAPGEMGEFGVLPQHIPLLTTLRPGILTIFTEQGKTQYRVGEGFAEAGPDRVVVLTETCEAL